MKNLLYYLSFIIAIGCIACEGEDDDGGMPLIYTICGPENTYLENEKSNITTLSLAEIPSSIRSYVASEFAGYEIRSATSFQVDSGGSFIEVTTENGGNLLFDAEGAFICGDDTFSLGDYGDDDDDYIDPENLPQSILDYISANYPNVGIDEAEFEDGVYEVELDNGVELCFDSQGNFIGNDCDDDDDDDDYIDPANLPQSILDYIATNYPNAGIDEAEFEDGEYEVELDNGVELCFDSQGNYIGDDC